MPSFSLGGLQIYRCELAMPLTGPWTADVWCQVTYGPNNKPQFVGTQVYGQLYVTSILDFLKAFPLAPNISLRAVANQIVDSVQRFFSNPANNASTLPAFVGQLAAQLVNYLNPAATRIVPVFNQQAPAALTTTLSQALVLEAAGDIFTGNVTALTLGPGTSLTGIVLRSGVVLGQLWVRMAGGVGYMGALCIAQSFGPGPSSVGQILAAILGLTTVTVDTAASDSTILSQQINRWTLDGNNTVATEVSRLLSAIGSKTGNRVFWQITPAGNVAVYTDRAASGQASQVRSMAAGFNPLAITDPTQATLIRWRPELYELTADVPGLCVLPGQMISNIGGNTSVSGEASRLNYLFNRNKWMLKAKLTDSLNTVSDSGTF